MGAPRVPGTGDDPFEALASTALVLAAATAAGSGRTSGSGDTGRMPDHVRIRTPAPVAAMNRVMLPRLDGPPSVVEARVDTIGARFGGLPFSWWLDPGARPGELLTILRRLEPSATIAAVPAMRLPLVGDSPTTAARVLLPEGGRSSVELEVVTTAEGLAAAGSLAAAGFGAPADLAISIGSLFTGLDSAVAGQVVAVVASLDGAPASTGLACLAGDVAGIYNVATLPAARRRGLGTEVMRALLEAVRARGGRLVVLESTEDGRPLYERLGFRVAGDFQVVSIDEPLP